MASYVTLLCVFSTLLIQCVICKICLRELDHRGEGNKPRYCDMYKGECLEFCEPGYSEMSFGCWQDCPEGFKIQQGIFCEKPAPYKRGFGYDFKEYDSFSELFALEQCSIAHSIDCEVYGNKVYPKCKKGYTALDVGHICTPVCPDDMVEINNKCVRNSYDRKPQKPCAHDEELIGDLCFPICKKGWVGDDNICWKSCPLYYSYECGLFCTSSNSSCIESLVKQDISVLKFSLHVIDTFLKKTPNDIFMDTIGSSFGHAMSNLNKLDYKQILLHIVDLSHGHSSIAETFDKIAGQLLTYADKIHLLQKLFGKFNIEHLDIFDYSLCSYVDY